MVLIDFVIMYEEEIKSSEKCFLYQIFSWPLGIQEFCKIEHSVLKSYHGTSRGLMKEDSNINMCVQCR